ncbi:MAG: ChaN family lipoprotein [Gammaproteobacteria bacterium]|nr:ChaN family lipoprotein [Gammaproteobacteria bacterium]
MKISAVNFLTRLCFIASCCALGSFQAAAADDGAPQCTAQVAQWLDPASGAELAPRKLFDRLASKPIVLLGEAHDNRAHHRWQHDMLAALHSRNANLMLGLEMLPRQAQPTLDDWSQGELDEATFLEQSKWNEVWGFDPDLYLPLLYFARMNRLPVLALNIDRKLVAKVGAEGWQALDSSERMGLSDPAPASADYRRRLGELYAYKLQLRGHSEDIVAGTGDQDLQAIMQSEGFANFVDAQLTWDRAMAEALAAAHLRDPEALIVGIIGRGHLEYGNGIPHQLADLGIDDVEVLLPVDADDACAALADKVADAVFVVETEEYRDEPRPRLGIMIETAENGVRVMEVIADSVAERAGMLAGDIIQQAAGFAVGTTGELIEVVQRQAAGTWLPLKVLREDKNQELIARFPQSFE